MASQKAIKISVRVTWGRLVLDNPRQAGTTWATEQILGYSGQLKKTLAEQTIENVLRAKQETFPYLMQVLGFNL